MYPSLVNKTTSMTSLDAYYQQLRSQGKNSYQRGCRKLSNICYMGSRVNTSPCESQKVPRK
ncbi:hypothetical protein AUK40_04545 [Candidatus Wirthbacteria bacterium CG2_30_54_11]|uniref:Uncharacterized protein n=1 Tax=Candidatus Wirthbacteria bacterium CG2_30_54_11 TaxID=1817892 RepID=A0A1J5II05_9BACT|nr:MAG: hypothetical protein AUK40_04545 [Candidatus Wirthbacteria bacterium CG2_30_54_11]